MQKYEQNLKEIVRKIEASRSRLGKHHIVKIVAISKYNKAEDIESLYTAGQRAFGESKVQDLSKKNEILEHLPIEWHFVGRLQKNKINHLLNVKPYLIHSIDSFILACELDKRVKERGIKQSILLQINSANEDTKAGVLPKDAIDIYKKIEDSCPSLDICGVMSIGAHTNNIDTIKRSFDTTKKIFDSLGDGARILSMGMSGDFELAIECGSNMVRIGSSLFNQDI
mgnify:CR=1 FL=1